MNELVWQRFRDVAFPVRLEMIRLIDEKTTLCVSRIAVCMGVDENNAGKHLQKLASGGFLRSEHRGKFLFYSTNPEDRFSSAVLDCLREGERDAVAICKVLTAFTHERRILIVKALDDRSLIFSELCGSCRISGGAMKRHLTKLAERGFITEEKGKWMLAEDLCGFEEELLKYVTK